VLALCHLAVLASGTAALEAALFAKPMVVMYKVSKLSAWVYKNSIVVDHYSMPNHLTNPPVVKELIQDEANCDNLVKEVTKLLENENYYRSMHEALRGIRPALTTDSGRLASDAIEQLIHSHRSPVE
jgi:lipid-A-disaccharide synthase